MTPHTMITLRAALEVEKASPAPSHFATVDPDVKLMVGGPRTDPTASVRSILETSNTIFSALMSSLSYWCMSRESIKLHPAPLRRNPHSFTLWQDFSLESPDVLLVVFVMGAVLNSLSMIIIVRSIYFMFPWQSGSLNLLAACRGDQRRQEARRDQMSSATAFLLGVLVLK